MADSKPKVLLVQLGDALQVSLFKDMYSDLRKKIEAHYDIIQKNTAATVIEHISQPAPQLKAVLVIDGGLSKQKFKKVQIRLSDYAKAGGTVLMCCNFSNFVSGPDFIALTENMELSWEWGDYHRTTFALNPAFRSVFGAGAFGRLQQSYSMKTVHLKEVSTEAKVYIPTSDSRTQSLVFPPGRVDTAQCPAVLEKHGEGYVGFIGDVNNEVGTQTLLMAMLDFAAKKSSSADTSDVSTDKSGSVGGCAVCGDTSPIKKCSRCKGVQYCSIACQKEDWTSHKLYCQTCITCGKSREWRSRGPPHANDFSGDRRRGESSRRGQRRCSSEE